MEERIITQFSDIESTLEELCVHQRTKEPWHKNNHWYLFRGQSNATHEIQSTLERAGKTEISFDHYYRIVHPVLASIQSVTSNRFAFGKPIEIQEWCRDYDSLDGFGESLHAYEFLSFIRHHGFPSPLIDWSLSPYVALYFACSKDLTDDGALWTFTEYGKGGKGRSEDRPQIKRLGHYITTHERHHRQQGDYLVACHFKKSTGSDVNEWHIIPFKQIYDDQFRATVYADQDIINKIVIKAEAKIPILKRLDSMNINAYSLYNSLDALMETQKFRRFDFNE